ncbi:hypothetical protein PF005_g9698 [Phytophthora fragariae]|nr:hypothetical protein PF005_g9698 [Phytophthora fragariae]
MRQQQLIEARRDRREELRAQVQRLEQQVHRYQFETSVHINSFEAKTGGTVLPSAQLDQRLPGSSESLIERLVQQNEQIMALLLPRRYEDGRIMSNSASVDKRTQRHVPDKTQALTKFGASTEPPASVEHPEEESHPSILPETQNEPLVKKPVSMFQTPTALSWLPEFEWTDEDELTLDKLENDADALPELGSDALNLNNGTPESGSTANTRETNVSALKDQKARDRFESRKRFEALLSASLKNASGTALKRPRWRLESEAESDDVSPFELEEADVMDPVQIFRASVLAVLYTVQLKNMLMAKKIAEKENTMRDFEAMLRVYFDATRMWLGKVVRTPLLSMLQDSSLDVDISTKSGLAGSSLRGFAKKFGGILARRPPPVSPSSTATGQTNESAVDQVKLLKLKVRMKGILQSLSKAIEKKEVPSGILDFWKRISSDGVYFPPSYQLFNEERQSLEFDALGATRRMDFDGSDLIFQSGSERSEEFTINGCPKFSRFNVVVINFLLVRILIPHVILEPWNVGIGSKNIGKQTSANLLSLATLLYCVCRQLSPLPPPIEPPEASFLGRRRSKTVAPSQPSEPDESSGQPSNGIDPALTSTEPNEEERDSEASFLTIDEIGRRLLSEKSFPSKDSQVIQFVKEHQATLNDTLSNLRFQLHGANENLHSTNSTK